MRTRIFDVLQRTTVLALVGIGVYGLGMAYFVHQDTLARGRAIMVQREEARLKDLAQAKHEEDLANQAQANILARSDSKV